MDGNTKGSTARPAIKVRNLLVAAALAAGLGISAAPAMAAGNWGNSESATATDKDYVLAEKRIKDGDYQGAIELLTKVAERQPKNADIFNYLGYTNRKLGNYEVALVHYQRALALDPKHRGAHEYLGELYLTTGEIEKAEAQLDRLDSLCFFGCDEHRELKAKVAEYKKQKAALPGSPKTTN